MEFVNFVNEEDKEEFRMMYKPYIYATVIDCSLHCVINEKNKFKVIEKKNKKYEID